MEVWSQIGSMGNFFKGIGVLYQKGLIDKMYIYELQWIPLETWWEKMGSIVLDYRNRSGKHNYFEFVDYLYDEMKGLDNQRKELGKVGEGNISKL